MIKPENIVRHELIGLRAVVADSKDKAQVGVSGEVVDETQKNLIVRGKTGERMVAKKDCVLEITIPDGTVVRVDGRLLQGRPEERIKKRLPKRWGQIR